MADQFNKYKLRNKVEGKTILADPLAEQVVWLLSKGTERDQVRSMCEVTEEQIDSILSDPLAQARLLYKRGLHERQERGEATTKPKTPEQYMDSALLSLWKISKDKGNSAKDRIYALKVLVEASKIAQRRETTEVVPTSEQRQLESELEKAFSKGEQ